MMFVYGSEIYLKLKLKKLQLQPQLVFCILLLQLDQLILPTKLIIEIITMGFICLLCWGNTGPCFINIIVIFLPHINTF